MRRQTNRSEDNDHDDMIFTIRFIVLDQSRYLNNRLTPEI
jgi:hypothetical protein